MSVELQLDWAECGRAVDRRGNLASNSCCLCVLNGTVMLDLNTFCYHEAKAIALPCLDNQLNRRFAELDGYIYLCKYGTCPETVYNIVELSPVITSVSFCLLFFHKSFIAHTLLRLWMCPTWCHYVVL